MSKILIIFLFSVSVCIAQPCTDSVKAEYSRKCGIDDVDKVSWFSANFLVPILPYLAAQVWPVPEVTDTTLVCPEVYKQAYIQERNEVSAGGTFLGIIAILWFGLLIF